MPGVEYAPLDRDNISNNNRPPSDGMLLLLPVPVNVPLWM